MPCFGSAPFAPAFRAASLRFLSVTAAIVAVEAIVRGPPRQLFDLATDSTSPLTQTAVVPSHFAQGKSLSHRTADLNTIQRLIVFLPADDAVRSFLRLAEQRIKRTRPETVRAAKWRLQCQEVREEDKTGGIGTTARRIVVRILADERYDRFDSPGSTPAV